jgi:drug/metabolite transporter (DMT)-like permease
MSVAENVAAAPAQPADRLDWRAVLILIGCCACWGVNQVAIKIANAGISPILQVGLRSLLAAVLVFYWSRARGVRLFDRDGTLWAGILAGIMFGGEFVLIYVGLDHTTASRGVVFLYLSPFVVAFGAHYLIPGDRLTVVKLLGLTAAMGEGLAAPGQPTLIGDLLLLLGALLLLLGAAIWGATTVLVRVTPLRSAAPEKTLFYQLVVSGLLLPPASYYLGEPGIVDLNPQVLLAFAYTFLIVAFVSYIAWFWLVRNYPPTRVTAFTFLSPVFGVAAGNLMLGEVFTPSLGVALALVAFGIFLVNRPGRG